MIGLTDSVEFVVSLERKPRKISTGNCMSRFRLDIEWEKRFLIFRSLKNRRDAVRGGRARKKKKRECRGLIGWIIEL